MPFDTSANTNSAIIPRDAFRKALAFAGKVAPKRTHTPILACANIAAGADGVTVSATDLDMAIRVTISDAIADSDFSAIVPADHLAKSEKAAPNSADCSIDVSGGKAAFSIGGVNLAMDTIAASDWPDDLRISGPMPDSAVSFELSKAELQAMIDRTQFAISTEETRYYLNGIYLHIFDNGGTPVLRAAATDGHRLARYDVRTNAGTISGPMPGVILPRGAMKALGAILKTKGTAESVAIQICETLARFTFGNVEFSTKTIDGTFPDYMRVIPSGFNILANVAPDAMAQAVKSIAAMGSTRDPAVKLTFTESAVSVSIRNPETGESSVSIACETVSDGGPKTPSLPFEVGVNSAYLLDCLAQFKKSDSVEFSFVDNGSPLQVACPDVSGFIVIQMPMRV